MIECFRDIVGVTEIAHRLGTTPGTVHQWRHRHADFSAPLVTLVTGPVWAYADVERSAPIPRKPGRPRKPETRLTSPQEIDE